MQCCVEPLGQNCTSFLPAQCWPMANRQFYEENNICNVVLTMLGQQCIGEDPDQCCLNTFGTT